MFEYIFIFTIIIGSTLYINRPQREKQLKSSKIGKKTEDAALETMELLSKYLIDRYPSLFEYQQNKEQIQIKTTGEIYPIKSSNPLKYAS
ncbi:unnamed protein product [Adineta steineri]|uniref:Uncharacterized protein n=1 Tax=Adineta steineri TaxID=433720 RepID=A0A818YRV6_9BILA|nr:unnamed protein product [Adineta steineri]CAF1250353.1 unnamed protein product [Adineta steineri]CAF3756625.1 unnamed protein product [Adineta steineri]